MKQFLKKQVLSFFLVLLMVASLVPAASAATRADIELSVDAGEEVALSRSTVRNLYNNYSSSSNSSFLYLVFTDYDGLDSYGHFSAVNKAGKTVSLDEDDLDSLWFYDSASDIEYSGDCQLSGLTFVADSKAKAGTLTLKFTLQGTKSSDQVDGTLSIKIGSGGSSSDTISYTVKAGGEVSFDADDFYDFFAENYSSTSRSLRYVIFDRPSASVFSDGTLYYNYGRSSQEAFTRSSLSSAIFYYSDPDYGDYNLDRLTFVADSSFEDDIELSFRAYYSDSRYVDGIVEISVSGKSSSSSKKGDIQMEVDPDDYVVFDADDFDDYVKDEASYSNTLRYLVFTGSDNLGSSTGYIYYRYGYKSQVRFTASSLKNAYFYYDEDDIGNDDEDCYPLDDLSFVASSDFDDTVTLEFRAYYTSTKYVTGTVTITSAEGSVSTSKGDITYPVSSSSATVLKSSDFKNFYDSEQGSGTFRYITFTNADTLKNPNGLIYSGWGTGVERILSWSNLDNYRFYADTENPNDYEDGYALSSLSFVAGRDFSTPVALKFRAYSSSNRYAEGVLVFQPGSSAAASTSGDIRYSTVYTTNVQINPNDIARLFNKSYPSATLQYVRFNGVPQNGSLYYNYYNASQYGAKQTLMTSSNIAATAFYFSPSSTSQYSLSELTFLPNNRTNYCDTIPFTAYGSGGQSVSGTILISVTLASVSEVYGVTPKNTAVSLPSSSIYSAVASATGTGLSSIRLLKLPAASVGTVYVGSGTSVKANTTTQYTYASGTNSISQLRFVPASGYTGSVEIPYVAYNSSGTAIASGNFCLGIVNSMKKFTDVTTSTWCYKYVSELSDAGVISGYSDSSFKPNSAVTYGAALKLVMLAAGYSEQAPTNSNVFSGYLAKAKADGLVSGTIDLTKPITRLQVAQLAAKAMKLNISNLSSVKPFTDTSDPYVQALNAAGIVEGYFSNGTSTFKPSGTLTRGQISAIVWRMRQV